MNNKNKDLIRHRKEFRVDVYDINVICLITDDVDYVHKFADFDLNYDDCVGLTARISEKGIAKVLIALNPNKDYSPLSHGVIAHESLHASLYILERCHVEEDYYNNPEVITYLTEYITNQVTDFFKKTGYYEKL